MPLKAAALAQARACACNLTKEEKAQSLCFPVSLRLGDQKIILGAMTRHGNDMPCTANDSNQGEQIMHPVYHGFALHSPRLPNSFFVLNRVRTWTGCFILDVKHAPRFFLFAEANRHCDPPLLSSKIAR
jgi:hypothetical protein